MTEPRQPLRSSPFPGVADPDGDLDALRESQRMLASLLRNMPGIAYRMRIDPQWTVEFISAGCFKLTGYHASDIIENRRISYEEITHPEDRGWVRQAVQTAVQGGRPYEAIYRLITAEGLERWVWERGQGVADDDGKIIFIEGFLTDMTERRRTEEKVKSQAALLDKARDAILVIDPAGIVSYSNQSAHELFGWDPEGVTSLAVQDVFLPPHPEYDQALAAVLAKGEWIGELPALGARRRMLTLESRWTLVRDDQGEPKSILLINTDVTDRRKLETQFLRSQRLESIGTLAGGIAHDLNNVLSPILTSLDLLRARLAEREDQEIVDIVEACTNRGAEMVKQILAFARGAEGQRVTLDPFQILQDIEKMIRETFPRGIAIHLQGTSDLWPILGNATHLHQVLLNLAVNARDAMGDQGVLTLRALNHVAGKGEAMEGPGRYVAFEVADTGTGISKEIRERIFEPFFTTKAVGEGTGLGLSTVQAIAKNHGGAVGVRSEVGQGTTFRVLIPASDHAVGVAVLDPSQAPLRGTGQLILMVDDEPGVRAVTQRTLENFGYRVLVAVDGAEGLAMFMRHSREVAAVITDLMMPVMDGPAMLEQLLMLSPEMPIIATTGLAAHKNIARTREAGVKAFLLKPFTAEALLRTLADLLHPVPTAS